MSPVFDVIWEHKMINTKFKFEANIPNGSKVKHCIHTNI